MWNWFFSSSKDATPDDPPTVQPDRGRAPAGVDFKPETHLRVLVIQETPMKDKMVLLDTLRLPASALARGGRGSGDDSAYHTISGGSDARPGARSLAAALGMWRDRVMRFPVVLVSPPAVCASCAYLS